MNDNEKRAGLKSVVILGLAMMLIAGCKEYQMADDLELQKLKSWMVGSFNSLEQAETDTNFFNIHLEMVPIWEDRTDAIFLYVEQAVAWALDKPYRQRIYRLSRTENGFLESAVYLIDNPLRFAGAWSRERPLELLTPDSLRLREGCAIKLKAETASFTGGTVGTGCESKLRGASYATSVVRIEESLLSSWDRGYDSSGVQLWGAVTGPYIFKKSEHKK